MEISRKEQIIITALTVFSVIWVLFIIPSFMGSEWFITLIPPFQYILFNLGFLVMFIMFVGMPISYFLNGKELNIKDILKLGFSFWLGVSIIVDLWEPPFFVNTSGEILIDSPQALTGTSIDGMLVWCWKQIGLSGSMLFYLTYMITPICVAILLAIILAPKQFIGLFKH